MQYAAMMGRELRAQLPLGEYLEPRCGAAELKADAKRLALVHRMTVMASKGLVPEMLEDLRAIGEIELNREGSQLTRDAARACVKVASYEQFWRHFLKAPSKLTAELISAARGSANDVLACVGKGMLWTARHGELPVGSRWALALQGMKLVTAAGHWPRETSFQRHVKV